MISLMVKCNQLCVDSICISTMIASMAMAGGTAPVNLTGVLVQTNAEILAGIVLTQLVHKGTLVIYSSYSTAMDLRLGTPPWVHLKPP